MYHGVHLPITIEGNYRESGQFVAVPGMPGSDLFGPRLERIDPSIAQKHLHSSEGNSIYYGMTSSLLKRFDKGFQFRASYTYSKAIDDVLDFSGTVAPYLPTRRHLERGLSAYDICHSFVASGSFESPFKAGPGHNWLARSLADITLSPIITLRSGFPFNLYIGRDVNGDLNTTDRPFYATQEDEVTEEHVAEIFVRINNQGTRLGQADFVLTLLSVFHGELRDRIEDRARAMSQESVIGIDTQQLLRAVCGVAFGRARMSAIYRYLRGVDPTTGEADPTRRLNLLNQLDQAADECIQPTPWRDYLLCVKHAGFVSEGLIASKNAIVNAYALYVRGRRAGVPKSELDKIIARWVFGSLLSARYSGSSETIFEEDLARVARLGSEEADGFVRTLDDALGETITGDYWTRTLVSVLDTQKAQAPSALAFRASQIVLGTRALFSDQLLRNLLDSPANGARAASEVHHLFPTTWLHTRGIRERRLVNQVANLADTGWHENSVIGREAKITGCR